MFEKSFENLAAKHLGITPEELQHFKKNIKPDFANVLDLSAAIQNAVINGKYLSVVNMSKDLYSILLKYKSLLDSARAKEIK